MRRRPLSKGSQFVLIFDRFVSVVVHISLTNDVDVARTHRPGQRHDAFFDPMLLSPAVSEEQIKGFADRLGTEFRSINGQSDETPS